jgi:adenylate kinase family enzyme
MDNSKDVAIRNPLRIFIGGGPLSGKSTQSEFLADELGLIHVNVGKPNLFL